MTFIFILTQNKARRATVMFSDRQCIGDSDYPAGDYTNGHSITSNYFNLPPSLSLLIKTAISGINRPYKEKSPFWELWPEHNKPTTRKLFQTNKQSHRRNAIRIMNGSRNKFLCTETQGLCHQKSLKIHSGTYS